MMFGAFVAPEAATEAWNKFEERKRMEAEGVEETVQEITEERLKELRTKRPESDPEIQRRIRAASGTIESLSEIAERHKKEEDGGRGNH